MNPSLLPGCLANELGSFPYVLKQDMSGYQTPAVVQSFLAFQKLSNAYSVSPGPTPSAVMPPKGHPEQDALVFYLLNHAATVVRQRLHPWEPLNGYSKVVEAYKRELTVRAHRMFYYLIVICTRESRHDGTLKSSASYAALTKKYGSAITDFHTSLSGSGSEGAVSRLKSHPPKATIGAYTKFLSEVFYKGKYSSAFGGPAWGKVADVLRDFVDGTLSAEMMMDTAFTLCHNNGPIFNKGVLFDSYSPEIYKILDVQRSGQIPQLVASKGVSQVTPFITELWKTCRDAIGPEFDGEVDWQKVEDLGSKHKYPKEKAKSSQIPLGGAEAKLGVKKAMAKIGTLDDVLGASYGATVEIIPGEFITVVEPKR